MTGRAPSHYVAMVSESDRRGDARVEVELKVEETTDNVRYFQRSANLSAGGMYLHHTLPHPNGTIIQLQFTLPGDSAPIAVRGEIVGGTLDKTFGMSVRFIDVDTATRERLERFIAAEKERAQ